MFSRGGEAMMPLRKSGVFFIGSTHAPLGTGTSFLWGFAPGPLATGILLLFASFAPAPTSTARRALWGSRGRSPLVIQAKLERKKGVGLVRRLSCAPDFTIHAIEQRLLAWIQLGLDLSGRGIV